LPVFGYDDAPHGHCEITYENVRVPASNILLGEGRGFEIAQGRLGPGRIHHCMRAIGVAERALELMCKRLNSRVAFGRKISEQSIWRERIAESRIQIDTARLLTLKAAYMMDTVGNKHAKSEIAMIKVLAPNVAQQVLDWSIQAHGAAGVSDEFPLAYMWAGNRTLRIADGPDEVHRNAVAKLELAKHMSLPGEDMELPVTRS
jgi:acyl-CoA dehydrogenase